MQYEVSLMCSPAGWVLVGQSGSIITLVAIAAASFGTRGSAAAAAMAHAVSRQEWWKSEQEGRLAITAAMAIIHAR